MPYSLETILQTPKQQMKGDLFIRCPTTGQPIPIDLHTEIVALDIRKDQAETSALFEPISARHER